MVGKVLFLISAFFIILSSSLLAQTQEWLKFEAAWINAIVTEGRYVWIGTSGYGLARLDTLSGQITWYNTRSNPRLPSDWVYSIAIDDSGNKWLGLYEYIAKFDGSRFISYRRWSEFMREVAVDDSGYVWAGTEDGFIYRFDRRNFPPSSSSAYGIGTRVTKILFDDSMNVYVVGFYRGIYKLDSTSWSPWKQVLSLSAYSAAYDKKNKVFWISTSSGVYKWDKINQPQKIAIPEVFALDIRFFDFWMDYIYSISVDTVFGKVWFAKLNASGAYGVHGYPSSLELGCNRFEYPGGIFNYDGTSWTAYRPDNSPLPNCNATVVYVDNQSGKVWVGLAGAVAVFNGSSWKVFYIPDNNISSYQITSMAIDKFGNKWFGTMDGGLRKFDGTTWTIYTPYNSQLPDFRISAIGFNPVNNDLWVGINAIGVARFNGNEWTLYDTINSPLKTTRITGFTFDQSGNVWIATRPSGYIGYELYGGVYKFDGTSFVWYYTGNSDLPSEGVQSIVADKSGNIWLGTAYYNIRKTGFPPDGGVVKISGTGWSKYDTANGFPSIWTWRVAVDSSDTAWIGTLGKGLIKFDGQNAVVYNRSNSSLPGDTVFSIAVESSGKIWVATNKGIAKFDRSQWTVFTRSNTGLPVGFVGTIAVDKQGNKWFISYFGWRILVYREGGVILDVERVVDVMPSSFKLYQNYPNPFNPNTTIEFEIPERASVKLVVYDILGREVEKLVDKELEPGRYKVNFEGSELSSGVYFYRLEAGKFADVRKMLLVK